jgi:quinol monooxygenase YgiN
MLAIWVKCRIKPEARQRFLRAIEIDALGSEPALEAHRATPHYEVWRGAADTLDGPTEALRCRPVFPAARGYWDASAG